MNEPVRILQVVTIMNLGGLENFIMNLYRQIDRSKIQFDFLVHRQEKGAFDDEIESLGGKIYRLQPIRLRSLFQYQRQLRKFFEEHTEYKIVHSHINANSAIILSAAKKADIPVRIAHSHIDTTATSYYFLRKILKSQVVRFSTHNLACSVNAGKWLYGNHRFTVLNNAINTERFRFNIQKRNEIRNQLGISENQILIGHVGRFNLQKNHEFLINTFNAFLKIKPESNLILIGAGKLKSEIISQIGKLNITEYIIMPGVVYNPEDYFSAMDLFLFPSLFEGLGIVAVEAQCNGLPVVMSDIIPKESALTDLVITKSLKETVGNWSKTIETTYNNNKNNDRNLFPEIIKSKGFDIAENAMRLQDFYLKEFEKL